MVPCLQKDVAVIEEICFFCLRFVCFPGYPFKIVFIFSTLTILVLSVNTLFYRSDKTREENQATTSKSVSSSYLKIIYRIHTYIHIGTRQKVITPNFCKICFMKKIWIVLKLENCWIGIGKLFIGL